MNFENFNNIQEYLLYIKQRQDSHLDELHKRGLLLEYIRILHQEMNDKYPEMIVKTFTDDEMGGE